jgi:hypothetical protein
MPPPAVAFANGMICGHTQSLDSARVSEYEVFKEKAGQLLMFREVPHEN